MLWTNFLLKESKNNINRGQKIIWVRSINLSSSFFFYRASRSLGPLWSSHGSVSALIDGLRSNSIAPTIVSSKKAQKCKDKKSKNTKYKKVSLSFFYLRVEIKSGRVKLSLKTMELWNSQSLIDHSPIFSQVPIKVGKL